eukprot:365252-Chlamydomonas_euryale.AAC.25
MHVQHGHVRFVSATGQRLCPTTRCCRLNIPTAPASGLLLDGPFFGHYNEATATSPDAGVPFYVSAVQEHVDSFKQERIYPAIARGDPTEVWLFLKSLTEAAFGFSKWISADTVWEKSSGIRSCS